MRQHLLKTGLILALSLGAQAAQIAPTKASGELMGIGVQSQAWERAVAKEIKLYPQLTTKSLDITADKAMRAASPLTVTVRALISDTHLALHLNWADETLSIAGQSTNRYSDAFAVQFPQHISAELPYIGMGHTDKPVIVHLKRYGLGVAQPIPTNCREDEGILTCNRHGGAELSENESAVMLTQDAPNLNLYDKELYEYQKLQRSRRDADYQRTFVAEGFGSTTELKGHHGAFYSTMHHENGRWSAVIVRSLKDDLADLDRAVVPVALAVWDGDQGGRDGVKWLSGWTPVVLGNTEAEAKLMAALNEKPKGNVANGEQVAVANCAACHRFGPHQMALEMMAPDLTWIGGQATAGYIRESILEPHAVVVTGYNQYAHPSTPWYNEIEGQMSSTMPAFGFLPESDVEDMVTYFKSLK